MKIKLVKFLLFSLICVLALTVLFINLNNNIEKEQTRQQTVTENDYYTIKEYDGKIAVFKNTEDTPITVYEAYISLLPEYDRNLLKKGIKAKSTEELQKIIEDYTS